MPRRPSTVSLEILPATIATRRRRRSATSADVPDGDGSRGLIPNADGAEGDVPDGDGSLGDVPDGDDSQGDVPDGDGSLGLPLQVGLGYHSDTPDRRDHTLASARPLLERTCRRALATSYLFKNRKPKKTVDLRRGFRPWPVRHQGSLHSCTAHAVTSLIHFRAWHGYGKRWDLSRLFLYKVSRRLLGWGDDSGASLRATFKATETCGIPSEDYWPYIIKRFDANPDGFLYTFGQNFRPLLYTRLDEYGMSGKDTLVRVKRALSDGLPVAFGFPVYSSVGIDPGIPMPGPADRMLGGHATLAVGYNDNALIFRNSWGRAWGIDGYGYLPNEYVVRQWACDFWTVLHPSWLNSTSFDTLRSTRP